GGAKPNTNFRSGGDTTGCRAALAFHADAASPTTIDSKASPSHMPTQRPGVGCRWASTPAATAVTPMTTSPHPDTAVNDVALSMVSRMNRRSSMARSWRATGMVRMYRWEDYCQVLCATKWKMPPASFSRPAASVPNLYYSELGGPGRVPPIPPPPDPALQLHSRNPRLLRHRVERRHIRVHQRIVLRLVRRQQPLHRRQLGLHRIARRLIEHELHAEARAHQPIVEALQIMDVVLGRFTLQIRIVQRVHQRLRLLVQLVRGVHDRRIGGNSVRRQGDRRRVHARQLPPQAVQSVQHRVRFRDLVAQRQRRGQLL